MTPSEFRLLVLADMHYVPPEEYEGDVGTRRVGLGRELTQRGLCEADAGGGFDALAIMGDSVNDGTSPHAGQALAEIATVVNAALADRPLLVVPGNHDVDFERVFDVFGVRPGAREIGGYRFVVFADPYQEGDVCTRSREDLALIDEWGSADRGPLVVLQHNPMNPELDSSTYPYMLTNRDQVMAAYSRAKVLLSLSGHYHPGQVPSVAGGVRYFTVPAICDPPHPYALVTLRGRDVLIETVAIGHETEDTDAGR